MSDQFGTRSGGGQGEAAGGGHEDDPPVGDIDGTDDATYDATALDATTLEDSALDDAPLGDEAFEDPGTDDDILGVDDDLAPVDEQSSEIPASAGTSSPVPTWVGVVSAAGLALVVVQALVVLGTISQGFVDERFEGDLFHKIGVAVLTNIDSPANGLMIVVGAVLVALPAILGSPQQEMHERRRALALGLGAVVAILLVAAAPIAVRARVYVIDAGEQTVDALVRRVLATYVAGTLGTALVALGTCLGLSRYSRTVTPRP